MVRVWQRDKEAETGRGRGIEESGQKLVCWYKGDTWLPCQREKGEREWSQMIIVFQISPNYQMLLCIVDIQCTLHSFSIQMESTCQLCEQTNIHPDQKRLFHARVYLFTTEWTGAAWVEVFYSWSQCATWSGNRTHNLAIMSATLGFAPSHTHICIYNTLYFSVF